MKNLIDRLTSKKSDVKIIKKDKSLGIYVLLIKGSTYVVDGKSFEEYYKNET